MASGCKAAIGCIDARVPVRASYVSLYKWPESDAEFVKSVAMARRRGGQEAGPHRSQEDVAGSYNSSASGRLDPYPLGYSSPRVVDSYSCRQMYLRSYTFSRRKETVPERTMAYLGRVRECAAVFPFLPQRGGAASDSGSVSSASNIAAGGHGAREDGGSGRSGRRRRRKRKRKGCAMVKRLHEASCCAVRAIFHRLLACAASVEVADGGRSG